MGINWNEAGFTSEEEYIEAMHYDPDGGVLTSEEEATLKAWEKEESAE